MSPCGICGSLPPGVWAGVRDPASTLAIAAVEWFRESVSIRRWAVAAVVPWVSWMAQAGVTSANYRIEPTAFSGGATHATSADYSSFSGISSTVVGTATSAAYTAHYGFFPSAGPVDVTGRFVFYNQSSFDGNNAAANAGDDAAIATDKVALLPGGTAVFANYTSYSRGLNGIMVDLPNGAAPTASDFAFKKGNNNTPSGWVAGPTPSSVTVRAGAGAGGADRVTLIWPTSTSVKKEWMQVTVLATTNTGLSSPDIFYFGNAIGETGNSTANAFVSGTDESAIRANPRGFANPAPVDFRFDINRDRQVSGTDVSILRANATGFANALRLIAPGAGGDALIVSADVQEAGQRRVALLSDDLDLRATEPGRLSVLEFQSGGESTLHGWFPAGELSPDRVRVQASDDLHGTWRDLVPAPVMTLNGDAYTLELPTFSGSGNQFYRILIITP